LRCPEFWRFRQRRGDGRFAKPSFEGWARDQLGHLSAIHLLHLLRVFAAIPFSCFLPFSPFWMEIFGALRLIGELPF